MGRSKCHACHVICQPQSQLLQSRSLNLKVGSETIQTWYRVAGKGQLEEQGGFLTSKSLTLSSAPPWALFDDFHGQKPKQKKGSEVAIILMHKTALLDSFFKRCP